MSRGRIGKSAVGDAFDGRLRWWLGSFLITYYALTFGGRHYSIDGILMFQSAKALLFRGSLHLDPPVRWGHDLQSLYGIGMTLAYVPLLILWWPLFSLRPGLTAIPYDPTLLRNPSLAANLPYFLCSWLNPLLTALTGCLVYTIGRMLGLTRGWALAGALGFGIASPAAVYARLDFNQPLAALTIAVTAWGLLRAGRTGGLVPFFAAVAALGYAILTRLELAVLAPFVAAWVMLQGLRHGLTPTLGRLMLMGAVVALATLVSIAITQLRAPGPIIRGATDASGLFTDASDLFTLMPLRVLAGGAGLLASPGRGLLFFFPLTWLAVPGLVRLMRTRPVDGTLMTGLIGIPFALYASYFAWWGGNWTWGPRFMVPLLPLLAVLAAYYAAERGWRRLFGALVALGLLASLNGILFDLIDFGRWLYVVQGMPDNASTQFDLVASTLVSGWWQPPGKSLDVFWLRLLDAEQIRKYGRLFIDAEASQSPLLAIGARAAAVAAISGLLAWLAYSGCQLMRLAGTPPESPRSGSESPPVVESDRSD
jgi:hypothetical protein